MPRNARMGTDPNNQPAELRGDPSTGSTLRGAPSPFLYNPYDGPFTGLVPVCLRLCRHNSCPANLTIPGASPGDFPNPAQSCAILLILSKNDLDCSPLSQSGAPSGRTYRKTVSRLLSPFRAFCSLSSPLIFHEFMSSDSFPAPPPFPHLLSSVKSV